MGYKPKKPKWAHGKKPRGIVVDDYKVMFFRKKLSAAGFEFTLHPFDQYNTLIKVYASAGRFPEVQRICDFADAAPNQRGNSTVTMLNGQTFAVKDKVDDIAKLMDE